MGSGRHGGVFIGCGSLWGVGGLWGGMAAMGEHLGGGGTVSRGVVGDVGCWGADGLRGAVLLIGCYGGDNGGVTCGVQDVVVLIAG